MIEKFTRFFSRARGSQPIAGQHIRRRLQTLDQQLVYALNKRKLPGLRQMRYLPKVLQPQERRALKGLAFVALLGLLSLGVIFYLRNFLPQPVSGGDYIEGVVGAPQYINPLLSQTNDVDADLARLLFAGLLRYDRNLRPVADLAESWEISPDQKTYTFILKPNLVWSDNEPLTADDVIFTVRSIQDPSFKSPLLVSLRGVSIQKVDDRTIRFTLPDIYPQFLDVLTVGLLPVHIWGEIPPVNANLTEYNLKPIGAGAWTYKSLVKDRLGNILSYTIVPNEHYPGAKPYIQKLTFNFYPDFETAVSALRSHAVQGISFLPKKLKSDLADQRQLATHEFRLPQFTGIFFNQRQNTALQDKNVRIALGLAIDKQKIVVDALAREGELITGPLLPQGVSTVDPSQIPAADVGKAKELLDQAGWTAIGGDEYLQLLQKNASTTAADTTSSATSTTTSTPELVATPEQPTTLPADQVLFRHKGDQTLTIKLTTVNQPENVSAANVVKKAWQEIGVVVELEIIEASRITRDVIKPRQYQALLYGEVVGADADPYPFWHSSQAQDPGLNLALFSNRQADKLLEDARKSQEPSQRRQLYLDFQTLLLAEVPAIFLYRPTYSYVVDKKIQGIDAAQVLTPADRFNTLATWYIKTKRQFTGTFR